MLLYLWVTALGCVFDESELDISWKKFWDKEKGQSSYLFPTDRLCLAKANLEKKDHMSEHMCVCACACVCGLRQAGDGTTAPGRDKS